MYRSLATKYAVAYLVLFLIGTGLQGALLLHYSSKEIISSSEKNLVHISDLVNVKFVSYLEDLKRDITHLSNSPYLLEYLDSKKEKDQKLLTQEYFSLIRSKPDYAQIRFIGIADGGREIVRVERNFHEITVIEKDQLQQKDNRDYFLETIKLSKNSMYISPIDLNKEYNKISLPQTPTFRVAYPVYRGDSLQGIVVINTKLSLLFESLKDITKGYATLRLVNNEGYYVLHEAESKAFGFEFNDKPIFEKEFGKSPKQLHDEHQIIFEQNGSINAIHQIPFGRNDYQLFVVLLANKDLLFKSYFLWRNNSFCTIFILGIAFLLCFFLYMKHQTKELKDIILKIRSFSKTLKPTHLPTDRKDEIGQLSRSFQDMSYVISSNMIQLANETEKAEQAVREKEEFLENMSHEIRNPLQSIIGLCNILKTNAPAPHQVKLINSLRINASNLHSLVNDILDYKKILRGDIQLNEHWCLLEEFLEEIYSSHNYFAITHKIKFSLYIDKELKGKEIKIERERFTQIFNNLIINAIKFTKPEGKVQLTVRLRRPIEKGVALIRFAIEDTGVGIEAELLKKIKERYITQNRNDQMLSGFGLGLSIVIKLLAYWNTDLQIESIKEKGSIFYFDIERTIKEGVQADRKEGIPTTALSQKSLLVIDDDIKVIELYRHIFSTKVKQLVSVSSLEQLAKEEGLFFDIIISDYRLANNTIEEEIDILKRFYHPKTLLYILSATAFDRNAPIFATLNLKASYQKPIKTDFLLDTLNRDSIYSQFGIPNLDNIKNDYDYEPDKYLPVFHLLSKEWKQMSLALHKAILQKNEETYKNIFHKLTTTLRRLELYDLEKLLAEVGANLVDDEDFFIQEQLVMEAMDYFGEHIESKLNELQLTSL